MCIRDSYKRALELVNNIDKKDNVVENIPEIVENIDNKLTLSLDKGLTLDEQRQKVDVLQDKIFFLENCVKYGHKKVPSFEVFK